MNMNELIDYAGLENFYNDIKRFAKWKDITFLHESFSDLKIDQIGGLYAITNIYSGIEEDIFNERYVNELTITDICEKFNCKTINIVRIILNKMMNKLFSHTQLWKFIEKGYYGYINEFIETFVSGTKPDGTKWFPYMLAEMTLMRGKFDNSGYLYIGRFPIFNLIDMKPIIIDKSTGKTINTIQGLIDISTEGRYIKNEWYKNIYGVGEQRVKEIERLVTLFDYDYKYNSNIMSEITLDMQLYSIDELPIKIRRLLNKNKIFTISDLVNIVSENQMTKHKWYSNVKGIGMKHAKEIEDFVKLLPCSDIK